MKLPLTNALRKRIHVETALLQDEVMEMVYAIADKPVLHGGTSIWRCYSGNRFSEDLDFYFPVAEGFEGRLREAAAARGLNVIKYKKTQNTIFAKITDGNVEVRLEVGLRRPKEYSIRPYEKADGSMLDIYALSPEALEIEKISAYESRMLVRDIYDIYHLRNMIGDDAHVRKKMESFLVNVRKPSDERTLRTIVYAGPVPTFQQMIDALKGRFSR